MTLNANDNKTISQETEYLQKSMPKVVFYLVFVLKNKYKGIQTSIIANIVIQQIAGVITAKRIKFEETQNTGFPNWYSIGLMPSGFGKDRILNDIKNYFLKFFEKWYQQQNEQYRDKCLYNIEISAINKFPNDEHIRQRQAYTDEELRKVRNIVHEVSNGTSEGFFADAKAVSDAGFGSVNLRLSEGGNFLNNMTTEQKQFFNRVFEAYDGHITSKSIKGENREENLNNIPTNLLLLSDPTSFQDKSKYLFNSLMELGIGRRAVISFQAKIIPYDMENDPKIAYEKESKYYDNLKKLEKFFSKIFLEIPENSTYKLTYDAFSVFYKYKIKIKKLTDSENNSLLSKEISSRELKSLKLSCLYATLNHPQDLQINPEDMEQAIGTVEFLSKDIKKFYRYKPKYDDKYDQLLDFFIEHEGQEFTKTELVNNYHQEFGYSRDSLRKEFDNCMSALNEVAFLKGYYIKETPINRNSGNSYTLLRQNNDTDLDANFIGLEELLLK